VYDFGIKHPAHRVNHIGFAAAIGANHRHQLAGYRNGGRVNKRFEPGQFQMSQAHKSFAVQQEIIGDCNEIPRLARRR